MAGLGGAIRSKRVLAGAVAGCAGVAVAAIAIVTLTGGEAPAAAAPASTAPRVTIAPATAAPTTAPTAAPTTAPGTTAAPATAAPIPTTAPATAHAITAPAATAPATTGPPTVPATEVDPIDPPQDTHAQEPVIELGRIQIPAIGVDMAMYEGIRMTTLDRGPGHWPGSAMPGSGGNVVVGGHRTSKHAVFRHVDDLVPGDEIIFVGGDGARHIYVVNRTEVVDPSAVWIVEPTATPQATLFACHPPGSTRQRIIVFSDYRETVYP